MPALAENQLENVPCDLCGARDEEFLYTKPGHLTGHAFRLVRCRRCGLIYLNPRLNEAAITALYDKDYYHGKGFDPLACYLGDHATDEEDYLKPPLLVNALKQYVQPPARMLDYGCGGGRLLRATQAAGYAVEGFEVSPFAAQTVRDQGFQIYSDPAALPENAYDVVTAVEVLEHCYSPTQALTRIAKSLKPGGLFLYTTENFDKFYDRWKCGKKPPQDSYVTPEGHIYFFSTAVMRAYFKKVGFSQVIPFETPAYMRQSWAFRSLVKFGLADGRKESPETAWEKSSYFLARRFFEALGTRRPLPLAIK